MFCWSRSSAQVVSKGQVVKQGEVNFTELANQEKVHPWPKSRKLPFDEDEEKEGTRPVQPEPDPSEVFMLKRALQYNGTEGPHRAFLPTSPAPNDSFLSTVSDGTAIPPDTHGAVDSNYCVTAINTTIHIQTRTGTNVSSVAIDHFWTSVLGHGAGSFDPRVHYDPIINRWVMVCDAYGQTAYSQIMIAVSATSNPTGSWHLYAVACDASGATWLDFPSVGFNSKWLGITGNYFSNTGSGAFTSAVVYLFDISSLASGASATYTKIMESSSFSLCPALTYDTSETSLFMIENYNGGSGKLRLWKATGPVASPTVTSVGYPATSTHWGSAGAGGADFAPQVGTTHKLQTNDDRTNNFVQRNHNLWCAYTAFFPASSPTRSSAMWWAMDTTGTPSQVGLIDDPTGSKFYAFPSIAVNKNNDALVGFACFSSAIHPSCGFALHLHTDPADSIRPVYVYRHGQQTYYETFGGSDCRWGDYSATCVDPRNDDDFWTLQESVPSTGTNIWDTWWANVQICPTPIAPVAAITPAEQCSGTTALYSVGAVAGATSYTWSVSGTGWSGSSTTDSIYITAGTGIATVTVTASNSCGPGNSYVFTITPAVVPPAPVINTIIPACVTSTTASFSATAASATSYTWTVVGAGWSGFSTTDTVNVTVGTGSGLIICQATSACGTGPVDTLIVVPGTVPTAATSITGSTPLCSGSSATYSTAAITGATSYTWGVSGTGWSGSSTTNTITVTVGTGTGAITVTPVNGCGSGTPFTLSGITPIIPPVASFSITSASTSTHISDIITFTGTAPAGSVYTWNFGGGVATPGVGAGPQSVYWVTPGVKSISLTVTDSGCSSTVFIGEVSVSTLGVSQVNMETLKPTIMPNPNSGTFDILFAKNVSKNITVKIVDMQGRQVYQNVFDGTSGKKVTVETTNLAPGNYVASIFIDGSVTVNQVTITK